MASVEFDAGSTDQPVMLRPVSSLQEYVGWKKYSLADWIVAFLLLIVDIVLIVVEPHHSNILGCDSSGDNCQNVNLSFPLQGEDLSIGAAFLIAFGTPLMVMVLCSLLGYHGQNFRSKLYAIHNALLDLALCYLFADVVTKSVKKQVGWPRPNFLAYCDYKHGSCTSTDTDVVHNAYESFPSGHASTAFSGLVYLALYIWHVADPYSNGYIQVQRRPHGQMREYIRHNRMWWLCICLLPVAVALGISTARIRQYYHNPTDTVAGALIGTVFALLVFFVRFPFPDAHIKRSASFSRRDQSGSVDLDAASSPQVSVANNN